MIVILSLVFWFCILATGFGEQSLGQILEIPIVIVVSVVIGYYMRNQNLFKVLSAIFLFVLLLRCFMPHIPEWLD